MTERQHFDEHMFVCSCGERVTVKLPLTVDMWVAMAQTFEARHKGDGHVARLKVCPPLSEGEGAR